METMYKKITKEDGTVEFIEVPAVTPQATKPAETKPEAKTFGEVMSGFWTWLKPHLSGGLVGAAATFAVMFFLGGGKGDVPQIPGNIGGSGDGPSINNF